MKIEFDNNIPIYIQLLDFMKSYIVSGYFKSGDRLPSVRDLSSMFKVNPNTMQKALSELEDEGLIYTERTNGKFVTNDLNKIDAIKKSYANSIIDDFILKMNKIGISKNDAIKYIKERNDL